MESRFQWLRDFCPPCRYYFSRQEVIIIILFFKTSKPALTIRQFSKTWIKEKNSVPRIINESGVISAVDFFRRHFYTKEELQYLNGKHARHSIITLRFIHFLLFLVPLQVCKIQRKCSSATSGLWKNDERENSWALEAITKQNRSFLNSAPTAKYF